MTAKMKDPVELKVENAIRVLANHKKRLPGGEIAFRHMLRDLDDNGTHPTLAQLCTVFSLMTEAECKVILEALEAKKAERIKNSH